MGVLLGRTVGLDGCIVGLKLGSADSATLGAMVESAAVGSAVGSALGSALGSTDGMLLCVAVGTGEGLVVGSAVGSIVGSATDCVFSTDDAFMYLNDDADFSSRSSGCAFGSDISSVWSDEKSRRYHTAKPTKIKPTMVTYHLEVLYMPIPTDNPPKHEVMLE